MIELNRIDGEPRLCALQAPPVSGGKTFGRRTSEVPHKAGNRFKRRAVGAPLKHVRDKESEQHETMDRA